MNNPLEVTGVCDSRDLIDYKEYLEDSILENYVDWVEDHNLHCDESQELVIPTTFEEIEFLDEEAFTSGCEDLIEEYDHIVGLFEEIGDLGDFRYGEAIIGDDYFVEYCKELIKEIGDLPRDLPSYIEYNIDWDGVASDLQVDYTMFNFQGDYYYIRY